MTQFGRKSQKHQEAEKNNAPSNSASSATSAGKDAGLTSHQPRVYGEFFKAIEQVGRRLERTEAERDRLASRVSSLESRAERDELTGNYYLPVKASNIENRYTETPKSVMAASLASVLIAVLALGVVLTQEPKLSQEQIAALQFNPPQFANLNPQSPYWERLDLSTPPASMPEISELNAANETAVVFVESDGSAVNEESQSEAENATNGDPLIASILESLEETRRIQQAEQAILTTDQVDPSSQAEVETSDRLAIADSDGIVTDVLEGSLVESLHDAPVEGARPVEKAEIIRVTETPASSQPSISGRGSVYTMERDRDLSESARRLERRAYEGNAEAQHDLATLYAAGRSVEINYERALYWFEQAAEGGIANAHYNLGVMAHQGLGRDVNLQDALTWYRNAGELGHPEALYNLGIAYTEGIGTKQQVDRGASYFKRAAESGVAQAAYNLGILHESSFMGGIDKAEAKKWYEMAARDGHEDAMAAYARVSGQAFRYDFADAEMFDLIEPSMGGDIDYETIVAAVQHFLIANNYLPGAPDGVVGPQTADAVRSYQRDQGLNVTGTVTMDLFNHIQNQ